MLVDAFDFFEFDLASYFKESMSYVDEIAFDKIPGDVEAEHLGRGSYIQVETTGKFLMFLYHSFIIYLYSFEL